MPASKAEEDGNRHIEYDEDDGCVEENNGSCCSEK